MLHRNRTACIIGSGESLPDYIHMIPPDAVVFSINTRPLTSGILKVDQCNYLVYVDLQEARKSEQFKNKVTRISLTYDADIIVDHSLIWVWGSNTAMLACAIAQFMGCSPIVLFGIDCYQGQAYFNSNEKHTSQDMPLYEHLERWDKCRHALKDADIRSLHPPLDQLFPVWKNDNTT
jgi:hypothetical protein